MPAPGKKPNEGQPTKYAPRAAVDWIEVPDVPYTGPKPEIPVSRQVMTPRGESETHPISALTVQWWNVISSMPQCAIWSPADWQFAVDTVLVHAEAMNGRSNAMAELRQRERIMGTTIDARRDIRIRYVPVQDEAPKLAAVASIAKRREGLLKDA